MITRAAIQYYWNKDHEKESEEGNQGVLRRRWARPPPRRKGRPQDRTHARHPDLYLKERQSRRRKTVNEIAVYLFAENSATAHSPNGS